MATVIQIKRSTASTAPTTSALSEAEMAYAQDKANDGADAILYIESINNDNTAAIHKVGGKYYTDLVDAATTAKTNNAIVKRDGSGAISADVTGDLTGNADTASAWATARTITLAGDLSGSVSIDGSGDVTLTGSVSGAEATSLAGDMTGDVYANNGTSKVLENGTDGTDATFTGAVTGNATTATTLATARTIGGVSFDGSAAINLPGVNAAGNQDTSGVAATATILATTRNIAITGAGTGTATFNGSADASVALTRLLVFQLSLLMLRVLLLPYRLLLSQHHLVLLLIAEQQTQWLVVKH